MISKLLQIIVVMRNLYLDYNIISIYAMSYVFYTRRPLDIVKKIFVAIERNVVVELKQYTPALVYHFASFYVINMDYPAKAACTMEFFPL